MPSSGTSHKEFTASGYVPEPCGYIQIPSPPSDWSVTIDGHKITPRVIQRTLRRCRDAGVDMWYVAQRLGIGSGAIVMYMQRERSIPVTVAKRFYAVFSSGESLPKGKSKKTIDWEGEEREVREIVPKPKPTPDYDGEALGRALLQKRREAQITVQVVARRAKCSPSYVSEVELGRVRYKSSRCSVIFRLCEVFNLDIRQYELKPRVDFPKFRQAVIAAKDARGDSWPQLQERAMVTKEYAQRHLKKDDDFPEVVYLDGYIERLIKAYDIPQEQVIIPRNTPLEKISGRSYEYSMLGFNVEHFRRDLRSRRRELKYTQGRLAEKAGTNQSCIHKLESGITLAPTHSTVKKICTALKLDMKNYFRNKEVANGEDQHREVS